MSVNVQFLASPVEYEEKHGTDKYEQSKFEVVTAQGTTHKVSIPQYEGKRGVEGLFYCKDKFDEKADDFQFDADDCFKYFPRILDQPSLRWWKARITRIPANAIRDKAMFDTVFGDLVTAESNTANPRDALLKYLETDDCKKPRKVETRAHANRIETLCLYANRLTGTKAELSEDAITQVIFNTFPNAWLNEFRLARGDPSQVTRESMLEFFVTKKAVQDAAEDQNKKRKKDDKESGGGNGNGNGQKKKKNDGNMCRKHKTHLWADCSENPKSKNYYLKPSSPFFRGGRGGRNGGRGDRGGYDNGRGRGGYSSLNSGGRGGGRGYYQNGGNRGDQHHNEYRGSDRHDDQYGRGDHYHSDQRSGGGRGSQDHSGGHDGYHNNRPGGWF